MSHTINCSVGCQSLFKDLPNGSFFAVTMLNGELKLYLKNGAKVATPLTGQCPKRIGVRSDELVQIVDFSPLPESVEE